MTLEITAVTTTAERRQFVDLPFDLYAQDPNWRAPLKDEVHALIGGAKRNPYFLHAKAVFFLAKRDGKVVGRISAQVCDLVQERRTGLGQWGLFEVINDPQVASALIAKAEAWLKAQGMTQAQGPISISVWDEPGLLVAGADTAPKVMMGHHLPYYQGFIEAAGYAGVKDLLAWSVRVDNGFPELVNRIVAAGERNSKFRIRPVVMERFDEEARIILDILNDAWSENWGFVPLTDAEVAHVGKKLKPIVIPHQVLIAEYEGEPVSFIISIPDLNELTLDLNGKLLPFGWAKLLWRLRNPKTNWFRVPLMGIKKKYQATRMASMLAFMMIEYVRRTAVGVHGASWAEIGWILEDNGPMISIAEAIDAHVTKTYRIYERDLT